MRPDRPLDRPAQAPGGPDARSKATDGLPAGEVARRLGVAVTTLRGWHRRYGLGPSGHAPGHHRRYTAADLELLERMRELTVRGLPPAQAARRVLGRHPSPGSDGRDGNACPGHGRDGSATCPGHGRDGSATCPGHGRDGGGRAIGVGRAGAAARGLSRAALWLDADTIADLVDEAIGAAGVVATWEGVIAPVLRGIGARHAATGAMIEVEHLFSCCVSAALARASRPRREPPHAPARPPTRPAAGSPAPTLLGCAEGERHTLPMEALAAALAEAGAPVRQLGAGVPGAALREAVRRTGPAAVALWAHADRYAVPGQLLDLGTLRNPPVMLLAAGPGWRSAALPGSVRRPRSLREAVSVLTTGCY